MKHLGLVMLGLLVVTPVSAQAPASPCEETKQVVAEYADILAKERTTAQVELAQLRAEMKKVQAQVAEMKKVAEKSKEEKK